MARALAPTESAARIDSLLDAALGVFEELGYSAAPVPAIAERARVAVGSIYRHFPGKEQVVNALYRREKLRMMRALFDGLDTDRPAVVVFRELWDRLGRHAERSAPALCFLEMHHHEAYLDDASRAVATAADATVAKLVRRWQRTGEVRKGDPAQLTAQVLGGFVGVVRRHRAAGRPISVRLARSTCEPAWRMLERPYASRNGRTR
jgi:TetR/AcrR family transcriptional regulator, repressor of fatR-cypB operon